MSSPRAIVQIFVTGSRILGKAFWEAGKQAAKNAKNSPQAALGNEAAGVGTAMSGSATDRLTRRHRMTPDEAQLILNLKRGDPMESVMKNYEHLFKANSPPANPAKPATGRQPPTYHSHYLQSKVFRARERLEAEMKSSSQDLSLPKTNEAGVTQPPSPEPPHGGAT